MDDIKNLSLSRQTITRRIAECSADNIDKIVFKKSKSFDSYSIVCDKSTGASDTAQLLIFYRY